MDRIWRDLIGGGMLMLVGSGRILSNLMDGMGMIAMGDGGDTMDVGDGEASSLGTSHGLITGPDSSARGDGFSCISSRRFLGDSRVGDGDGGLIGVDGVMGVEDRRLG